MMFKLARGAVNDCAIPAEMAAPQAFPFNTKSTKEAKGASPFAIFALFVLKTAPASRADFEGLRALAQLSGNPQGNERCSAVSFAPGGERAHI